MLRLLGVCLLCLAAIGLVCAEDNIVLLLELTRHGDRAPLSFFSPADDTLHWPMGSGKLSPLGVQQHQKLGHQVAQSYPEIFSQLSFSTFTDLVYIRSSDYDRTLMSGQAHLQGILQYLNESYPIPIHSVPQNLDNVINLDYMDESWCPKMFNALEEATKSPLWNTEFSEYNNTLTQITKTFGFHLKNAYNDVYTSWDYLNCYAVNNFTVPIAVPSDFYANLSSLLVWISKQVYQGTAADTHTLSTGGLLKQITQHCQDVISGASKLKYVYFSGHDSTIDALLSTFQIFTGACPPYASSVLMELHNSTTQGYYLKFLYNTKHITPAEGCDQQAGICSFSNFTNFYSQYFVNSVEDWRIQCGATNSSNTASGATTVEIALSAVVGVCVLAIIALIVYLVFNKKRSAYDNL